ncbi:MAG: hydrogenase maturation protease [Candidatus Deferrimicrobiaceae bacterium]
MMQSSYAKAVHGEIAILGLGNVLMGDDAFGPSLVKYLEAHYVFPKEVELIDAGTPGHDLPLYMEGWQTLIVVDAVKAAGAVGEVRSFRGEEVLDRSPTPVVSPHEPGLAEALQKLRFAGGLPGEVLVIGVIPLQTGTGMGLSLPVKNALPGAGAEVLRVLGRLGVTVRERTPPLQSDTWWDV